MYLKEGFYSVNKYPNHQAADYLLSLSRLFLTYLIFLVLFLTQFQQVSVFLSQNKKILWNFSSDISIIISLTFT